MATRPAFTAWMRRVDIEISRIIPGVTHHDLSDTFYWDNWDAGVSPAKMAREAIANDDLFGGLL